MENKIFSPSDNELKLAKLRREKRWEELKYKQYTEEQKNERNLVESEILETMFILKERTY